MAYPPAAGRAGPKRAPGASGPMVSRAPERRRNTGGRFLNGA